MVIEAISYRIVALLGKQIIINASVVRLTLLYFWPLWSESVLRVRSRQTPEDVTFGPNLKSRNFTNRLFESQEENMLKNGAEDMELCFR